MIQLTKPQIGELVDGCLARKDHALACWEAVAPAFYSDRPLTIDEYAHYQQYAEINSVPMLGLNDDVVDLRGVF